MSRAMVIVTVVGLVVGVLGGFLFWGLPARRLETDLAQAQQRPAALEREVEASRQQASRLEKELRSAQGRLKELEEDLVREREQRSRLEGLVSRGRK